MSNFMKIRLGEADLFHADGQKDKLNTDRHTEVTKLILAFRSFAISPKSSYVMLLLVITILDTNCYVSLALCSVNDFSLHSASCISNSLLTPEATDLPGCIMIIHKVTHRGPTRIFFAGRGRKRV